MVELITKTAGDADAGVRYVIEGGEEKTPELEDIGSAGRHDLSGAAVCSITRRPAGSF